MNEKKPLTHIDAEELRRAKPKQEEKLGRPELREKIYNRIAYKGSLWCWSTLTDELVALIEHLIEEAEDIQDEALEKYLNAHIEEAKRGERERIVKGIEDNAYIISAWESLEGTKTEEVCLAINNKKWQTLKEEK